MSETTTRRSLLGTMGISVLPGLLPSDVFAAPALPPDTVPTVEHAFSAHVLLEPVREIGRTPYGVRRRIPIIGGTFEGPRISGRIVPGGADWQLQRSDDYTVIEADYMLEAADGVQIHVHNRGLTNTRVKGVAARYLRTVPEFEAPEGRHAWLNQSIFVGSLQGLTGGPPAVMVHVFRLG